MLPTSAGVEPATSWFPVGQRIQRILKQRSLKDLSNDAYAMLLCFLFFLIFFIKAYVEGTHWNCIEKLMQFKWVPTTYAFMKK